MLKPLPKVAFYRVILELLLVIYAALFASQAYANSNSTLALTGNEAQWLTNSAFVESVSLRTTGRFTLWQPWLGRGEPAIDNPFSFALNPISIVPSLLYGSVNGIKYSIVLYAIFAGIGGWVLGRVLGLGWLGRLLLALLCVGRGNMHSIISDGYFQLGVTQSYLAWVAAAVLAIIRFRTRRYPVVLLAILLTLMFWAGNIYYTLPAVISVGLLTLVFMVKPKKEPQAEGDWWWNRIDVVLLQRVGLALLLTVGLSAITSLSIFGNQQYIGGHPNESPDATYESPLLAAAQFFVTERYYGPAVWNQTYYSVVAPAWFVALIFLIFPPITPVFQRFRESRFQRRVIAVALFTAIFFLFWGTGTNPIMKWIYANLPLIGQWRVLSRMMTVCALWIGVLVALRVDGLWNAAVTSKRWNEAVARVLRTPSIASWLHYGVALVLIVTSGVASYEVLTSWFNFGATISPPEMTNLCIGWLRAQHPNEFISVWGNTYDSVATYFANGMRFTHINADFHPIGMTPTIYPGDLSDVQPEYLISYDTTEQRFWMQRGYEIVEGAPRTGDYLPCLMSNWNTFNYAFSIPLDTLQGMEAGELTPRWTTPINAVSHQFDHIGMIVTGNPEKDLVIVAQELAWPGWRVTIDGLSAQLESVGTLIGVVVPKSGIPHRILFVYDPPLVKIGSVLTLGTILFCVLYLLHGERLIGRGEPRPKHVPVYPSFPPLSI